MAKTSAPRRSSPADTTLPMSVANMTFMVDRLGEDCAPLQFVRELTQNALAAVLATPEKRGEVIWDVDWNRHILTGVYKLAIIDTGIGMTGDDMVQYINKLSSSMHEQSASGNFGVGAKIAAAPKNHAGLVYLSWKDSVGYMIHLWRDPDTQVYGLRQFDRPDGTFGHWANVDDDIKPPQIRDHGTMVILLGNEIDENTMQPPVGTPMASRWVLRYLNTRYFNFPAGIVVKAREGWELPQADKHNFLRSVTGQKPWLDENCESSGRVAVDGGTAHWWILKPGVDQDSGHLAGSGHVAALYQDELYEMTTGRAGVTRLQAFGVIFGHSRVVIYVEPRNSTGRLSSNTARTNLLLNGEPLPWAEWAAQFRDRLPPEIAQLIEDVGGASASSDHRQAIRERLKQVRDLFRISRYRPTRDGTIALDDESSTVGGKPKGVSSDGSTSGSTPRGGRGGRAGDIYAMFLSAKGTPGEEFRFDQDPDVTWVSAEDGTRTAPDMEDRAAKFLPQQNKLLVNRDFRVFNDMVERWQARYSQVPASRATIVAVVKEWFEQQLIEAILGTQALRDSRQWSLQEMEKIWSEEALTAVVMPRYHIDNNIKRVLGAKLGTLKEKVA